MGESWLARVRGQHFVTYQICHSFPFSFPVLSSSSNVPIWLDDVDCDSFDTALLSCNHRGVGSHNCGHSEDVGLVCTGTNSMLWNLIYFPLNVLFLQSSHASLHACLIVKHAIYNHRQVAASTCPVCHTYVATDMSERCS